MSGIEARDLILDRMAAFETQTGRTPSMVRLPLLIALDFAKLRRSQIGPVSGLVMRHGVRILERTGLYGLRVQIIKSGALQFA